MGHTSFLLDQRIRVRCVVCSLRSPQGMHSAECNSVHVCSSQGWGAPCSAPRRPPGRPRAARRRVPVRWCVDSGLACSSRSRPLGRSRLRSALSRARLTTAGCSAAALPVAVPRPSARPDRHRHRSSPHVDVPYTHIHADAPCTYYYPTVRADAARRRGRGTARAPTAELVPVRCLQTSTPPPSNTEAVLPRPPALS